MKLVILESPYAGNIPRNLLYAQACLAHSLSLGEAPIASHLLYTQPGVLDDSIPAERDQGIAAGSAWRKVADYTVFYTDLGMSSGMWYAKRQIGIHIDRYLPPELWTAELLSACNRTRPPIHS